MSTPTPGFKKAQPLIGGPPQSVLQRLLEEIADGGAVTKRHNINHVSLDPLRRRPPPVTRHQPSVWVNGNSDAEDARNKLRAQDEARQKRRFKSNANNPTSNMKESESKEHDLLTDTSPSGLSDTSKHDSVMAFSDGHFLSSRTPMSDAQCSEYTSQFLAGIKRNPTPTLSLETRKRTRTKLDGHGTDSRRHTVSGNSELIMRGGGHLYDSPPEFIERLPPSRPQGIDPVDDSPLLHSSSFRPVDQGPRRPPTPSTPHHSYASSQGSESPATPPWMQPFQLMDGNKSIFLQVHGEDQRDNSLCLPCFRQHGEFNSVLEHGCEVCGEKKILTGHYWEKF
ncbi:hypothetical protein DM02DRAFT_700095 [Periconia macrospinosa]|uniref:Uncharacterized protein n=1 Tax=Periconia macrospinosa TaxID=97972 RepID=A0A2V1DXA2_9PLEO|nr:hypothetical protein DM02DRAFT_700095 [Periconia macrospinosa]